MQRKQEMEGEIEVDVYFYRRHDRYFITEHEPNNNFENKRAHYFLRMASELMDNRLNTAIDGWKIIPGPPRGWACDPITSKINEYNSKKRQIYANIIESCIDLMIRGETVLEMQKILGDGLRQIRIETARTYPNGIGYWWDGLRYVACSSFWGLLGRSLDRYWGEDEYVTVIDDRKRRYKPYKEPIMKNHHLRRPMVRQKRESQKRVE